jgi:shikimate kinase
VSGVGDHVLMIGMMGSGKTTVGREVACLMWRPFHDSDEEILTKTGMTVPEIFDRRGEAAFRAEEKAVLGRALASGVPSVIAVAGGAVFDPDSRRRIRTGGVVVWLDARPDILATRVGSGEGRPLLEHDPAGTIARLDAMRRPVYRQLADVIVRSDGAGPRLVASRVRRAADAWLEERRSCGALASVLRVGVLAVGVLAVGVPAVGVPAVGVPAIGVPAVGVPAVGVPA